MSQACSKLQRRPDESLTKAVAHPAVASYQVQASGRIWDLARRIVLSKIRQPDLEHGSEHVTRWFAVHTVQHGRCERTYESHVGIQCYTVTAHTQHVATVLAGGSNSQVESSAAGYRLQSPAAPWLLRRGRARACRCSGGALDNNQGSAGDQLGGCAPTTAVHPSAALMRTLRLAGASAQNASTTFVTSGGWLRRWW